MQGRALIRSVVYIACIGALIWPALYNGYPIFYSDSSSYLSSGFMLDTPYDRPITYGLFVRATSLNGLTLWTVILAQAMLVTWTLALIIARLVPGDRRQVLLLLAITLFLATCSSLPWIASQVMPDIFTPLLVLSFFLVMLPDIRRGLRTQLHVLFALCVTMHLSHIAFATTLIVLAFVLRPWLRRWLGAIIRTGRLLTLQAIVLACIAIMGSALSKSRNVFFMGAMVEHGITKAFLDEQCPAATFKLCTYKDALPQKAYEFVWAPDGPLAKGGGWKEMNEELGTIIRGTFTEPRFILLHMRASVQATLDQLVRFRIGDGWGAFKAGTRVHRSMSRFMPGELGPFERTKQSREAIGGIGPLTSVHAVVVVLSILVLLAILAWRRRPLPCELWVFATLVLVAIVANAWVSGTFAGAIDRLGSKMIWMLPLAMALALISSRSAQTTVHVSGD